MVVKKDIILNICYNNAVFYLELTFINACVKAYKKIYIPIWWFIKVRQFRTCYMEQAILVFQILIRSFSFRR